jgi:hypothetical protein
MMLHVTGPDLCANQNESSLIPFTAVSRGVHFEWFEGFCFMGILRVEMVGKKFGRMTVLGLAPKPKPSSQTVWRCRCDCGKEVIVLGSSLRSGRTKSCGCLRIDKLVARVKTHGATSGQKTREYRAWRAMKTRCTCPSQRLWHRYGGRGIKISPEWEHSFEQFLSDMGNCPPGCSLDRIDNDGNYEKSNCKWSSHEEQCAHTSQTVLLTYNGKTQPAPVWAKELGFKNTWSIHRKINAGLPIDKVFAPNIRP